MNESLLDLWCKYLAENQATIAGKITALRERYDLNQEWVAERAGYSVHQYKRFENGERKIEHEDIARIVPVILAHAESLKSPFEKVKRRVTRPFKVFYYSVVGFLINNFPDFSRVIFTRSFRLFTVLVIVNVLLLILILNGSGFNIGYAIAIMIKEMQLFIAGIL